MIHIMKERQNYQSPLREEQVKQTRTRILDGLVRTMASGITEVSIPAVAREAGVSIPTVYRYFRTKRELVEALPGYLFEKIGLRIEQPPHSPQELIAMVHDLFARLDGLDETIRAASISELSFQMRKGGLPARLQGIEMALAPVAKQFNEEDWQRLCRMVLILSSTSMVRVFNDYLGISAVETADIVSWAILTLTKASSSKSQIPEER
jgi:AcrR family transcriptional regulator